MKSDSATLQDRLLAVCRNGQKPVMILVPSPMLHRLQDSRYTPQSPCLTMEDAVGDYKFAGVPLREIRTFADCDSIIICENGTWL